MAAAQADPTVVRDVFQGLGCQHRELAAHTWTLKTPWIISLERLPKTNSSENGQQGKIFPLSARGG
jgi:hypothetical protein